MIIELTGVFLMYSARRGYPEKKSFFLLVHKNIQSSLVISNFTGPDKNVRVISSSRQPNCDVIGMTTVRLSICQNVLGRHMYMAI